VCAFTLRKTVSRWNFVLLRIDTFSGTIFSAFFSEGTYPRGLSQGEFMSCIRYRHASRERSLYKYARIRATDERLWYVVAPNILTTFRYQQLVSCLLTNRYRIQTELIGCWGKYQPHTATEGWMFYLCCWPYRQSPSTVRSIRSILSYGSNIFDFWLAKPHQSLCWIIVDARKNRLGTKPLLSQLYLVFYSISFWLTQFDAIIFEFEV